MKEEIVEVLQSKRWQIIILIVLILLLYSRSLSNQYVWDDKTFANWNLTKNVKYIPWFFRGALPDTHVGDYRPLKGIILTLDHVLWGDNIIGYRLQAIAIHVTAVLLVYLLIYEIFGKKNIAFVTSLLFALHPVQIEAIAFFTSSTDIAGVLFFLISFYFFIRWDKLKQTKYLYLSLIFWIGAIGGYEMTLVLPLLIILYKATLSPTKTLSLRSIVQIELPYLAVTVLYLLVRIGLLGLSGNDSYLGNSLYLTIIAIIKAVGKYIELLIFPLNLSVNHQLSPLVFSQKDVDYFPEAVLSQTWWQPQVILALVAVIFLVSYALISYRKRYYYTFCIGWFFVSILPVINIIPLSGLMAERYLYIASIGYCLVLAFTLDKLIRSTKSTRIKYQIYFVFIVIAILYSFRSWARIGDWQNSVTLWSKELEIAPQSILAHHNLGVGYMERGEFEKSLPYFEYAAVNNYAKIPKIYQSLGIAYQRTKRFDDAEREFQQALSLDAENNSLLIDLGRVYADQARFNEAIEILRRAIESDNYGFQAHFELGQVYLKINALDEAIKEFEAVIELNNLHMQAYVVLAGVYQLQGDVPNARETLQKGLIQDPQNKVITQQIQLLKK